MGTKTMKCSACKKALNKLSDGQHMYVLVGDLKLHPACAVERARNQPKARK